MAEVRTFVLTDGSQVSIRVQSKGPGGVIGGTVHRPILYLKEGKTGRYWRDPTLYSEDDIYDLLKRICQEAVEP